MTIITLRTSCAAIALAGSLLSSQGAQARDGASTTGKAAATVSAEDGADIVVTGTRAGQRKAVAAKRDADNTVEALYGNDVGKLPDQNVAEAVRRLPGISVANDQGEGRYVIIRGIDPNLVNVTLNGQTLPAPEPDGRQVKLDDLPSALINSVVVSKSLLPSQDANAIGGEVAIRTLTAFDRDKPFFLDLRGEAGWNKLNGKTPYEADGQVGGRFGTDQQFGAVVSVNYSRRPIESENFQGTEDYTTLSGIPNVNGLRDYNLVRTRLGIVGNFDWHPADNVKLYVRSSYSKFTDHETRDQNRIAFVSGLNQTSASAGTFAGVGTILVRRREEDDNTKSVTLGGELNVGNGKLEASGGYTKAVKLDPIRSEFTFTTATKMNKAGLTVDYDLGTDPYSFTASAPGFTDPSKFTLSKYNLETRQASEDLWQGRVDYTLPLAIGDRSSLKIGAKYLDRRKRNNQDKLDYKGSSNAPKLTGLSYSGDSDFYDGAFDFGQRIDYYAARAYVDANPSTLTPDPAGTLADSLSSDYDVRESITAGYAMMTLKFGGLTIIPGVRVEHTEDTAQAKVVDANSALGDNYNTVGKKHYTDFFPGVNAKYDITRNLLVRGAVTTAIGRPNYPDLAPYVVVEDDIVPNVSIGNPDLKPYKAVNFDGSLEYYPTRESVF